VTTQANPYGGATTWLVSANSEFVTVGGLRFYWDSIYLVYFALCSPNSLKVTQPKSATCSDVSAIWKRMSKIWDIPHYKWRAQNHLFSTLRNLTATLTAHVRLCLWNGTWYT